MGCYSNYRFYTLTLIQRLVVTINRMATDPDLTQSKSSVHKVVLLGDSGVGKTSIFYRIKDGYFRETSSTCSQSVATFDKPFRMPSGEIMVYYSSLCF